MTLTEVTLATPTKKDALPPQTGGRRAYTLRGSPWEHIQKHIEQKHAKVGRLTIVRIQKPDIEQSKSNIATHATPTQKAPLPPIIGRREPT